MLSSSWRDVVQSYMNYWDDYFDDGTGNQHHLLFVEGSSDNESLYKLFSGISKTHTDLSILRRDILFNFSNDFLGLNDFGRMSYKDDGNIDESNYTDVRESHLKNKFSDVKNDYFTARTTRRYNSFDFVIECIDACNNNTTFRHIHCFGMVDYDFGQHTSIVNRVNSICDPNCIILAQTEYHDRETTMLRYSIPTYISLHKDDPNINSIKTKILNSLMFSTKQGILVKAARSFSNYDKIRSIAEHKFRNNEVDINYDPSFFTDYINGEILSNSDIRPASKSRFRRILNNCINDTLNNIFSDSSCNTNEIYFNSLLFPCLERWMNGSMVHSDNNVIDEVFKYSNGHVLLFAILKDNTIIKNSGNIIVKEDSLLRLLCDVKNSQNLNHIINISPFKEYINYRNRIRFIPSITIERE